VKDVIRIDETRLTNSALYMIGIELGLRKADDEQFIDFVKRVKETFRDGDISTGDSGDPAVASEV
jgi:hypothetical protein